MRENLTIGFIGNPNCGKTTLFNAYTGANLKVANWPGVTVEKVEGAIKDHDLNIRLVDLPGTYSLTSYTMEEQVSGYSGHSGFSQKTDRTGCAASCGRTP